MKLYTASSWRNPEYDAIVGNLKGAGYEVYDFKSALTEGKRTAFNWDEIDPAWENWTSREFVFQLGHPLARRAFESDKAGMDEADVCILILPCGKSAHLEAGYMRGQGKKVLILLDGSRPELTYSLADGLFENVSDLLEGLVKIEEKTGEVPGKRYNFKEKSTKYGQTGPIKTWKEEDHHE